jgi:hypothetical protein
VRAVVLSGLFAGAAIEFDAIGRACRSNGGRGGVGGIEDIEVGF